MIAGAKAEESDERILVSEEALTGGCGQVQGADVEALFM
eukprot:gene5351-5664_t